MSEAILHPRFKEFERLEEPSGVSWRNQENIEGSLVAFSIRSQDFSDNKAARVSDFFKRVKKDGAEFRMRTAQNLVEDDGWPKFAGIDTTKLGD